MYEKSVRIWQIGTPRLTTISTSLRMRTISRIEVNTAEPQHERDEQFAQDVAVENLHAEES